jgi:hypothetical protein
MRAWKKSLHLRPPSPDCTELSTFAKHVAVASFL